MGRGPKYISLNFENDLDHRLDTKNLDFPIYLLLHALAEVYALRVLLFNLVLHG